ncbi:DEAD/DEAH box helicase [Candidatus Pacearchaeota archaeon]|nr:DEAD/DEAH box helicase [Candidatus Pacearchaeota archaeon]
MSEIIVNEFFSDEDEDLFAKLEKKEFEAPELLSLKVEAEEISKETEITELLCYNQVKDNIEYNLPHQTDGALQILKNLNATALLADEVGLGKTVTTGYILKEGIVRGFVKRALIITPPSLVDQWVAEMKEKFEIDLTIIEDINSWDHAQFAIASLDRVKIFNKDLGEFKHKRAHEISWDLVIVDEAHKLKARKTVRWKFVDRIQKKRFLILTATPFQNDLIELYNLLHLLKKGHLGTIREFRQQFLHKGNKRYPINPRMLKQKLEEVMLRRKRSETIIKYMKRIPRIVAVDLTKQEMQIYNDTCELLKKEYYRADGSKINGKLIVFAMLPKVTSSSRSAIESLQRIIGDEKYHEDTKAFAQKILDQYKNLKKDSKIEKLVEIVRDIREEDPDAKILIYTRHPTTLRYIIEKLTPFNLKIVPFTGGMNREGKTEIIRQFKEEADILISTETGAEGLNFQFCNNLINYDLPWNPMSVEQRIGRLDRIGQTKDMNIFSLATKNTMEEHVVDLIINKMCCVGLVIGELPIILFNLGLDGYEESGANKIEEKLMNAFLESKNNLEVFSKEVDNIAKIIDKGIKNYSKTNSKNLKLLDEK